MISGVIQVGNKEVGSAERTEPVLPPSLEAYFYHRPIGNPVGEEKVPKLLHIV